MSDDPHDIWMMPCRDCAGTGRRMATVLLRAAQDGFTEEDLRCKPCAGTGRLPYDPFWAKPGSFGYRRSTLTSVEWTSPQ
jgi:hypothetical protein